MITVKKIFIVGMMFSCNFNLHSFYNPYNSGKNYLGSYIAPEGEVSFTANSPELAAALSQNGVSVTDSITPSGLWVFNQTKGNGGYLNQLIQGSSSPDDRYFLGGYVAVQSNGNFCVVGEAKNGNKMCFIRGFDSVGNTLWSYTNQSIEAATGVVVDGAGGYYVCGVIPSGGGGYVLQIDATGVLSSGFNQGAPKLFPVADAPNYGQVIGVAVQSTGKILILGRTGGGYGITRLLSNGAVDPDFASSTGTVVPQVFAVDSQDRVTVVGSSGPNYKAERFLANGGTDTSFGTAGSADLLFGFTPFAVSCLSDDSIIVATGGMTVRKLTASGALDASFGDGGDVRVPDIVANPGQKNFYAIALLPNGQIGLSGSAAVAGGPTYFGIVILNSDGTLASNFSVSGTIASTTAGAALVQPAPGTNSVSWGIGYQSTTGSTGLIVTGFTGNAITNTEGTSLGAVFYSNNG